MDLQTFILVIACFAIGAAVGALLTNRLSSQNQKTQELEKHLHKAHEDLKSYQQEVTHHFAETAGLLKKMAESYRDVHNHLALGANQLAPGGSSLPIIKKLPEIDAITNDINDSTISVQPPLDYAPKTTPYDRGTLDETFQLDKVELEEKPVDMEEILAKQAQKP